MAKSRRLPLLEPLAQNLKTLKKAWGMTDNRMANVLGISTAVWTKLSNAYRDMDYTETMTVVRATGIPADRLRSAPLEVSDFPPAPLTAQPMQVAEDAAPYLKSRPLLDAGGLERELADIKAVLRLILEKLNA